MTTEIIRLADYRKNLSSLYKKAREKNIKYLVMVHGKPAFEVRPVEDNSMSEDEEILYNQVIDFGKEGIGKDEFNIYLNRK